MLSKSLAVIGVRWIVAGDNPFTEWYTYVVRSRHLPHPDPQPKRPMCGCSPTFAVAAQVVALLAAIAVFWVSRMDQGIQIFDAVMIIPLLQLAWTLFGILCGGIYFAEFDAFTFLQASRPMLVNGTRPHTHNHADQRPHISPDSMEIYRHEHNYGGSNNN